MARLVRAGDRVTAGTMNYDGQLAVRAVHSGGDTAVADVVRLVEAAQVSEAAQSWLVAPQAGRESSQGVSPRRTAGRRGGVLLPLGGHWGALGLARHGWQGVDSLAGLMGTLVRHHVDELFHLVSDSQGLAVAHLPVG